MLLGIVNVRNVIVKTMKMIVTSHPGIDTVIMVMMKNTTENVNVNVNDDTDIVIVRGMMRMMKTDVRDDEDIITKMRLKKNVRNVGRGERNVK